MIGLGMSDTLNYIYDFRGSRISGKVAMSDQGHLMVLPLHCYGEEPIWYDIEYGVWQVFTDTFYDTLDEMVKSLNNQGWSVAYPDKAGSSATSAV